MDALARLRYQYPVISCQFRGAAILKVALCFSLASASVAYAQSRLEGRVADPQGRPVAGATIIAIGLPGVPVSTASDANSRFVFDALPSGRYDLAVSARGLSGNARGIAMSDDATSKVDITMRVSAVTETLVVSASQIDQPLSRTADSVTVIRERSSRRGR